MFRVVYDERALDDLRAIKAVRRAEIMDAVDEQLVDQPAVETRHRKPMTDLTVPWDQALPPWQLSVGQYRVLYDVDDGEMTVTVRHVFRKPPHKTTGEAL